MGVQDDAERIEPQTLADWSTWLAEHHDRGSGVWLVTARAARDRAFDYEESVLEALRFGWVDSTRKGVDELRTMMWFAPRRAGSVWTRINKGRIARLRAEGRMRPAGEAAVAAAEASGMWTLMDDVEECVVPDDLAQALDDLPGARAQWDSFPPSAQKQALGWIVTAKRPGTRAERVRTTAERSARGERPRHVSD